MLGFVSLLVPVCWLLWLLLRTCLRACSCCQEKHSAARSPRALRISRVLVAFFGAAAVAGAACVWAAGPKLRKTLVAVVDVGTDQVNNMLAQAAAVLAVLTSVTPTLVSSGANTADITDAASTLSKAADSVSSALNDNENLLVDGLDRLYVACSVLGALLILLVLLAWLFHGLAPRQPARHALGFVTFVHWLFLVLGWVICGITYILYLLIGDACLALPDILANPAVLASKAPCLDPAFAADASSSARAPVYTAIEAANTGLLACSYTPPYGPVGQDYLCNPVVLQSGDYFSRAGACAAGNTTALAAFDTAYTATTCPMMSAQNLAQLSDGTAAAAQLFGIMDEVDSLVSCEFITGTLRGIEGECGNLQGAVRQLFGGLLLCCLAFSVLTCAGVWAWRHAFGAPEDVDTFKVAAPVDAPADVEAPAAVEAPAGDAKAAEEPAAVVAA